MKPIQAFWFAPEDGKLRFGDSRPVVLGETHSVTGDIVLSKNGLHASVDLYDAVGYATHHMLYLVELSGSGLVMPYTVVARNRKYIACTDCSNILIKLSKQIVLNKLHNFKPLLTSTEYSALQTFLKTTKPSKDLVLLVKSLRTYIAISDAHISGICANLLAVLTNDTPIRMFRHVMHYACLLDCDSALEYVLLLKDAVRKQTGWDI